MKAFPITEEPLCRQQTLLKLEIKSGLNKHAGCSTQHEIEDKRNTDGTVTLDLPIFEGLQVNNICLELEALYLEAFQTRVGDGTWTIAKARIKYAQFKKYLQKYLGKSFN